jgi:hypothetical protein
MRAISAAARDEAISNFIVSKDCDKERMDERYQTNDRPVGRGKTQDAKLAENEVEGEKQKERDLARKREHSLASAGSRGGAH